MAAPLNAETAEAVEGVDVAAPLNDETAEELMEAYVNTNLD